VIEALVAVGVALELACCLGLVLARDGFDRLHFVSASTTLPPILIAAAVVVARGSTRRR
jgi:multisubunit Na+/H+ antiporter MnhG subunit